MDGAGYTKHQQPLVAEYSETQTTSLPLYVCLYILYIYVCI